MSLLVMAVTHSMRNAMISGEGFVGPSKFWTNVGPLFKFKNLPQNIFVDKGLIV